MAMMMDPNMAMMNSGMNGYGPGSTMYRLSTQTNIVMIGYILLMLLNHLNLGQLIFGKNSKLTGNLRIWLFGAILLLTIVNCMLMLILKERRRPLTPYRNDPNIMPIMFTVFQVIILGITLWLYFTAETSESVSKKMNNVAIYTFINVSSMLSTWGFGLSRCTMEEMSMSGSMMTGSMMPGYP
jgi:hypothetical protein